MATIKSGASTDVLTVDVTSKAARVSLYDARGNFRGQKITYRGATAAVLAAAASAAPFFEISGSASKIVRLQELWIGGLTLTAVAYAMVELGKYSTLTSGGTATNLVAVPVDSNDPAATLAALRVFTAAPTAGTLVGNIGALRSLMQATTAAAAGIPHHKIGWDFRGLCEADTPTLRTATQAFCLNFDAAPASPVSLSLEVSWTEE